jgi:four helix bundle protein
MDYAEWEKGVPESIRSDSLWRMEAYRLSLFIADLGWLDVTRLMQDRRTIGVADQLYRAIGSTGANLAEGYSRGTSKDRARFYEYALGSARESRDWYYKGRHVLGDTVAEHRMRLLSQVIRLLLTMIPEQRSYVLRDGGVEYSTESEHSFSVDNPELLALLLKNIPLPPP